MQAFVATLFSQPIVAGAWEGFERLLQAGQEAGRWEFLTMSSIGSNVTNECPCKAPGAI